MKSGSLLPNGESEGTQGSGPSGRIDDTFDVCSVHAEDSSGERGEPLYNAEDTAEMAWSGIPQAVAVASGCGGVGPASCEASSTRSPIKIWTVALELEPILTCHLVICIGILLVGVELYYS